MLDVEQSRIDGEEQTFAPALVWIVNFAARNPYPRRFVYASCPERLDSGCICRKLLEFGSKCGHALPSEPTFCFQVLLQDAVHGGVPPVWAQIWETASKVLGVSAADFAVWSELEQLMYVMSITQAAPMVEICLAVKDFELTIQGLKFPHGRPPVHVPKAFNIRGSPQTPNKTPISKNGGSASPSSLSKPTSSSNQVLDTMVDLIEHFRVTQLAKSHKGTSE